MSAMDEDKSVIPAASSINNKLVSTTTTILHFITSFIPCDY